MLQMAPTSAPYEWIGIDVGSKQLDVYDKVHQRHRCYGNDAAGIAQLCQDLSNRAHCAIVCEASGGYEQAVAHGLSEQGFRVSVVNGQRVRCFAKATGTLAKTDKIDAVKLAEFGALFAPKATILASAAQQQLQDCVHRRQQLVDDLAREKNRRKQLKSPRRRWMAQEVEAHIEWLEKRIKQLDEQIEQLSTQQQQWREDKALLTSVKGIGPVVSTGLLAYLPELGQCGNKQIAALVGLAPFNRDSGQYRGKRSTWGGRAMVRSLLFMATMVAIRHNPPVKAYYQHLLSQGKAKKVALVACARKLLVCLNAMLKQRTPWQDERYSAHFVRAEA